MAPLSSYKRNVVVATLACTLSACSTTTEIPMASGEWGMPADSAHFQPILAQSKLSISEPNAKPGTKDEIAKDSIFKGIINESFYIDNHSGALVFTMEGYKLRSELRVLENFRTNKSDKFYHLSADFLPINPRAAVQNSDAKNDAMTFLQVHNKGLSANGNGYIPHPLLRVVYEAERNSLQDHYWAVIKNNSVNCGSTSGNKHQPECKNAYLRIDLGAIKTDSPSHFDIVVGNQQLVVKVDGETKVNHNISYWEKRLSYFKAGVYNQFKNGKSAVHFYDLNYSVDTQAPN